MTPARFARPRFGRLRAALCAAAACLALSGAAGAMAQPQVDTPASLPEDTARWTPLDQIGTDFTSYPSLQGGWDLWLDQNLAGDLTSFSGSLVFDTFGEFYYLGQLTDPDTGAVLAPVGVFEGTYVNRDSKPGWTSWSVKGLVTGETEYMNARFLSADVAILELRATPSATRVQRIVMTRTQCNFRYGSSAEVVVDGCSWMKLKGEALAYAYLSGECLPGPCYRLVSDEYYARAGQFMED